jgi:hypothetical protein
MLRSNPSSQGGPDAATLYSAIVESFVSAARASDPGFVPTPEFYARIASAVDGAFLAITADPFSLASGIEPVYPTEFTTGSLVDIEISPLMPETDEG